jgi:hypothetical protein
MSDKLVRRTWSKKSQISEYTEFLDIWDSGSHIFERYPDGKEYFWKVISRESTDSGGFIEVLKRMPEWMMPGQVLHQESRPFRQISPVELELEGWHLKLEEFQQPSYKDLSNQSRTQAYSIQNQKTQAYSRQRVPTLQQRPAWQRPLGQQRPQGHQRPQGPYQQQRPRQPLVQEM